MKVAFVHDWLVTYRGGEKVLDALLPLFPDAPIYTLFYDSQKMPPSIRERKIVTPRVLQRLRRWRKALLPVLPQAIEAMSIHGYDLIISTSSCVAKGVIPPPSTKHICYLHSPMRYIWDQKEHYMTGPLRWPVIRNIIDYISAGLRRWDVASSKRVDKFIVNSSFVAQRARRYYDRESEVIHPPVDWGRFQGNPGPSPSAEPYFLAFGAYVPYKRFDLAIEACEKIGKKLIVSGSGPDEARLRKLGGKHTEWVASPSNQELNRLLYHAEALLFPGTEDFGITAIEAMSSGTPVIAYNDGGAKDFIKPGITGIFFNEPTAASLAEVLKSFRRDEFDRNKLREFAQGFDQKRFVARMQTAINELMKDRL